MSPCVRRSALFLCLAALALTASACSKDKRKTDTGLTQQQADDLAQTLVAMAARDSGGWISESLPAATSPYGATQDTTFGAHTMSWTLDYTFYDAAGASHARLDSTIVHATCSSRGFGRIGLTPFLGSTGQGTYGHLGDTLSVDGLARSDTALTFSGFSQVDSGLISVSAGASTRYYLLDDVVEYSLTMSKNPLLLYPTSGDARVDAFVDVLGSSSRTNRIDQFDAVMIVTFDGSPTPLATIAENVASPPQIYRYRVNLSTGAVARAP